MAGQTHRAASRKSRQGQRDECPGRMRQARVDGAVRRAGQQGHRHAGEHGRGHRLWLLSNGAGLQGLAPLIRPIAARHRVVWFRPEQPRYRHLPNWPDPGFPPLVERQDWNIMEDPVTRLGIWLKGGGG